MKTFKEHLTESKRTYSFRVKIADTKLDNDILNRIERGLSAYNLADITKPKSLPISNCREFAKLGPVGREMFDIVTNYPSIPPQIQQTIHSATGIPLIQIYVTTPLQDEEEEAVEAAPKHTKSGKALLADTDLTQEDNDAQDHVGLNRIGSLLKDLQNNRGTLTPYTGVNDNILAKDEPKEKDAKTSDKAPQNNKSVLKPNTSPRGK